jgi:hypothetical protein
MAYVLDYQNRWSDAPEASLEEADRFASEAIARDDQDPHAHYCAALVAMFKKDFERWADAVDRALSLNPNYALALSGRGILHICTGEPAEAIPYIEQVTPCVERPAMRMSSTGADELAAVGHQHDLVAVLDGEGGDELAVALVHRHGDDALAAAARDPVLEGRGALAVAVLETVSTNCSAALISI